MQLKEKLHKNIDPKLGWFIVIVVATFFFYWTSSYVNKKAEEVYVDPYVDNSAEQAASPTVKPASTGAASISYEKALVKYANKRVQFDASCQATPNNMTFKNGTTIMLDNRSKQARTIKIGSSYSLAAYGFKIITLSSSSLPAKYLVDCGKSQNVATILLQK